MIAAEDSLEYFSLFFKEDKTRYFHVNPRQRIQDLDKSKKK